MANDNLKHGNGRDRMIDTDGWKKVDGGLKPDRGVLPPIQDRIPPPPPPAKK